MALSDKTPPYLLNSDTRYISLTNMPIELCLVMAAVSKGSDVTALGLWYLSTFQRSCKKDIIRKW